MAVYKIQNCTLFHCLSLYLRTINKEIDALWFLPGSAEPKLAGLYIPLGCLRTKQELNQSKGNWARRLRTEEQIQEWEINLGSKIEEKETENGLKKAWEPCKLLKKMKSKQRNVKPNKTSEMNKYLIRRTKGKEGSPGMIYIWWELVSYIY